MEDFAIYRNCFGTVCWPWLTHNSEGFTRTAHFPFKSQFLPALPIDSCPSASCLYWSKTTAFLSTSTQMVSYHWLFVIFMIQSQSNDRIWDEFLIYRKAETWKKWNVNLLFLEKMKSVNCCTLAFTVPSCSYRFKQCVFSLVPLENFSAFLILHDPAFATKDQKIIRIKHCALGYIPSYISLFELQLVSSNSAVFCSYRNEINLLFAPGFSPITQIIAKPKTTFEAPSDYQVHRGIASH